MLAVVKCDIHLTLWYVMRISWNKLRAAIISGFFIFTEYRRLYTCVNYCQTVAALSVAYFINIITKSLDIKSWHTMVIFAFQVWRLSAIVDSYIFSVAYWLRLLTLHVFICLGANLMDPPSKHRGFLFAVGVLSTSIYGHWQYWDASGFFNKVYPVNFSIYPIVVNSYWGS